VGIDDPYKVIGFVSLATCDTNWLRKCKNLF
jgi:hypothetical protein